MTVEMLLLTDSTDSTERDAIAAYASALDGMRDTQGERAYRAWVRAVIANYRAWLKGRGETDDTLCLHTDEERELIELVRAEQAKRDAAGPNDDMEDGEA